MEIPGRGPNIDAHRNEQNIEREATGKDQKSYFQSQTLRSGGFNAQINSGKFG